MTLPPRPTTATTTVSPAPATRLPSPSVRKLENKIKKDLTAEYKKLLGSNTLSAEITKAIADASKEAAERATGRNLQVEASKIAKNFYRLENVDQRLDRNLKHAKDSVMKVAGSADLDEILAENAKMLRKKWQALVTAGFTQDESFQLIKAEVEGKAMRRS